MPCCLSKRHICELYHVVLFLYFSLLLSTMFVYSIVLHVHRPFELVMEKSGVETRYSEQTMLSGEVHVLLVTYSSSEEDSETDDQSYPPPRGAWSNLAGLCCSYRAYGIFALLCHFLSLDMLFVNATCLVLITIYVNYAMPPCCKTLYMWIIQCYLVAKALYMWIMQCHAV